MKTLADTNGFRIQCECGEQTQTYTRIGAAREAYREHQRLEHPKPHVRVNVYGHHYAIVCKCGHETNMYKNSADAHREYIQHAKEEHKEFRNE